MPNPLLGDLLESQYSSFDAARLTAAAAVFIYNSFFLLAFGAYLESPDAMAWRIWLPRHHWPPARCYRP
ncbi:hypothetical protein [Pelagibacterium sp.]|uniref:hypothetical protein n=1 Tax=Pelagibacterium sp. TaxID=1967288 RepID=UPI003A94D399